ncbi:MAG: fliF [Solirubrobacterales bacterium]|nr:fliF [Solirubrobacterales bacterium]
MPTQLLTSLSLKGKLILAGCAVAFLVTAILLVKMAGAPSYVEVMAGVDPAQTGKITAALDARGIGYELRANGTAIAVDQKQTGDARIALAEAGLSGTTKQPGFELLDKQKLGASNFQQQVAYQRALEGQIANTIGQIAGVGSAQVSLTLPKDQLFADEAQPATAAVLLGAGGDGVDPGAVRGIANLVSSSVQGLKTANVTITDAAGQMLWPTGDAAGGGASSKPAAEARYNAQLEASLNAMLISTLGPDKAHVQVHSDLNVNRASQERLQYAKKGVPLTATNDTETLKGTGGSTGGAAGTASNVPSYAQTAAGGGASGKSDYKHVTKSTTFGVDKLITKTQVAPGAVNRLDVALVLDKAAAAKLGPAGVKSLQAAVASAAGVQRARGDTLALSQVAFAKPVVVAPPASAIPTGMLAYAKTALLGLAALLFLFFVSRHLRKRETGAFADEPSWLRQLNQPGPPQLGAGGVDLEAERQSAIEAFDAQEAARKVFANDPRAIALEEIVAREPEKIAQHLRSWITEDNG